ncbi:MAG: hypothetical protein QOH66_1219 [Actinomycetota bacterium]|nr:hypothetical protein [Acidimicrobiales bacterium]MEA2588292.1 hypothetical protein [Actinomycetota bacterium]
MRALWPVGEAAQADYEQLRTAALEGTPLLGPVAARFERQGLWGLIARPHAGPLFVVTLVGAARPAWTPYGDPRAVALADSYELVITAGAARPVPKEEAG